MFLSWSIVNGGIKSKRRKLWQHHAWRWIHQFTWLWALALLAGCGINTAHPEAGAAGGSVAKQSITLPDARSVDLYALGLSDQSINLQEPRACPQRDFLGLFGYVLGPVCETDRLLEHLLYGSILDQDGDGSLTCADPEAQSSDEGLVFKVLCNDSVLSAPQLVSWRASIGETSYAVSFQSFDSDEGATPVGSWTAAGADSGRYPADIRIWSAGIEDELTAQVALALSKATAGTIYVAQQESPPQVGSVSFGRPIDTATACASVPTLFNCYWRESTWRGPDLPEAGLGPSGLHLLVLSDAPQEATFYFLEAKITYSEAMAAAVFNADKTNMPANFDQIREIYVRLIQSGDELWGSVDFRNEEGTTIVSPLESTQEDLGQIAKNGEEGEPGSGLCQKLGTDTWGSCAVVDYQDYESIWQGDASFDAVDTDTVLSISFGEPPQDGIVQDR